MAPAPTGQLLDETRLEEHLIYGSARLGTHRDNPVVRRSVWDGAQQRELPTLLTPKAELERLDVPSRVAKLRAGEILTPSSNYTYTRTYATSPTVPAIPAMTAQHTVVGTGCTNVHRAEDRQGNRLFATIATSQLVNGSTVHTLYLLDRNGDVLWNSQGIRAAANTVTHSCQVPGSPNKHYLFTIGSDGRPYIHLIDLSITTITQGAVVLKNVPLDTDPASVYDRALAVVDDRTAYGRTMLYAVRRQGTDYTLMGLDLEALTQNGGGLLAPLAPAITGSALGQQGLLQLRPDGTELAFVVGSGQPMGAFNWATATLHRYALSPDHLSASPLGTYSETNCAIHYLDYSPAGQYLYYTKTGVTLGNATHQIMRQNLSNAVVSSVSGRGGDIRRTKHGDMLVATPAWAYNQGEAFKINAPNSAAPTVQWGFFSQPDARGEAAIGLQPLVYELLPATSTRSLNQKRYELADHLGNVRAVVSDRKLCNNAALPTPPTAYRAEVLNQTDYYPFGMISNATTASGGDYRFGFNGKENDDEVHGATGTFQDYGMRAYDPRMGRFPSVDPIAAQYPWLSPYQFAGNSPIRCTDLDGMEPKSVIEKWHPTSSHTYDDGMVIKKVEGWWVYHHVSSANPALDTYYYYDDSGCDPAWKTFTPLTQAKVDQRRIDAKVRMLNNASKRLLGVTFTLTTAGGGKWGIEILQEGAEQLTANGFELDKLDRVDMAATLLPAWAEVAVSSLFDDTEEKGFQSVFSAKNKKSSLNAGIDVFWKLAGKLIPSEDVVNSAGRRLSEFFTGVAENMGSDQMKPAEPIPNKNGQ